MKLNFCTHVLHVCPSRDLTSGGAFYFRRIYLVVRSTYAYKHTCPEGVPNHNPAWELNTLRRLCLLYCCVPLNRWQISPDMIPSPLFATATKTKTSKGLACRLNKSACNSANCLTPFPREPFTIHFKLLACFVDSHGSSIYLESMHPLRVASMGMGTWGVADEGKPRLTKAGRRRQTGYSKVPDRVRSR